VWEGVLGEVEEGWKSISNPVAIKSKSIRRGSYRECWCRTS
jgi:hypothetical protein